MIEPTEKQIHQAVIEHWRAYGAPGSLLATIPNMRAAGQAGLTKGIYDLLCIAPGFGAGLLELKTRKGRLSSDQIWFGELLKGAGVPCAVSYGRDEPIAVLREWGLLK